MFVRNMLMSQSAAVVTPLPTVVDTMLNDGSTDYIALGNDSSLQPTAGLTTSVWFNTANMTPAAGNFNPLFARRNGGTLDWQITHILDSSATPYRIRFDHNGAQQESAAVVTDVDTWYHIVMTYDEVNAKFYVNGVLDSTVASTTALTTAASGVVIGLDGVGGSNYITGALTKAIIYNRAVSASEVTSLYNSGNPKAFDKLPTALKPTDTSCIYAANLDSVDSTADDESTYGNDGTINGTPVFTGPEITIDET